MERRDFLKAGAAAGAAVATTGCATGRGAAPAASAAPTPVTPEEIAYLTTGMDRVLAGMDGANLVAEIVPADVPVPRDDPAATAQVERLLHKGIRSMYVSGLFLDQTADVRAHPEVQKRVIDTLPVMDEAIRESTTVLTGLTLGDQRQFQQVLRDHPEIGMRLAEVLDQRAGELGISHRRRRQLRMAAMQVSTRLRNQHPGVLAEECLVKTNKAYVRHGERELARRVAVRTGEQMFWAPVTGAASTAVAARAQYAQVAPQGPASGPASRAGAPSGSVSPGEAKQPGSGALTAAGWMFGIGLGTLLAGIIIVEAGAFPGVFAMTVGVVLILAALVTAIVGAIIRAASG